MAQSRERTAILVILCVLFYLTTMDIWEDLSGGDSLLQIILDLFALAAILALLLYIYILEPLKIKRENAAFAAKAIEQSHDLKSLSSIARKQLEGLGVYIKVQFDEWDLTPAEQDVALFLLKGLSMKEIAKARDVSERTTREQATIIFRKTNLSGRAALSAFFLEDLLLPESNFERAIVKSGVQVFHAARV